MNGGYANLTQIMGEDKGQCFPNLVVIKIMRFQVSMSNNDLY